MSFRPRLAHGLFLVLLMPLAGCSGSKPIPCHPVRGQVFHGKRPAVGAVVIFHAATERESPALPMKPNGTVQPDGSFAISTYGDGDGAPAGAYRLTVEWPYGEGEEAPEEETDRLQGRYADPQTSRLTFTVQEGTNQVPPIRLR